MNPITLQFQLLHELLVRVDDYYQINNVMPRTILLSPTGEFLNVEPLDLKVIYSSEVRPFEVVVY